MSSSPASAPSGTTSTWLSEWTSRTPVFTRYTLYLTTACTLLAMLLPSLYYAVINSGETLMHGQVWRLVTAPLTAPSFLAAIVSTLLTAITLPPYELELGTAAAAYNFTLLVYLNSIAWAVLSTCILAAAGPGVARYFSSINDEQVQVGASGIAPMALALITRRCMADLNATTSMCGVAVGNRWYPLLLLSLLCLLSLSVQVDCILGVLTGVAHNAITRLCTPSSDWFRSRVPTAMQALPGYVLPSNAPAAGSGSWGASASTPSDATAAAVEVESVPSSFTGVGRRLESGDTTGSTVNAREAALAAAKARAVTVNPKVATAEEEEEELEGESDPLNAAAAAPRV